MKKLKKVISTFLIMFLFTCLMSNSIVYALDNIPKELIINTGNTEVGQVDYGNYSLSAYKIKSKAGIGYCLEIDREYPSGQVFKLKGDCSEAIKNILIAGYPNKSAQELNLNSDDDAYFATQIAIWSVIDGYNVNKFSGSSPKVLKAIKNIYENSRRSAKGIMVYEAKEYYADEDTQDVVMLFKATIEGEKPVPPTEEKPQPPVPPEEEKPIVPVPPEEKPVPPIEKPVVPPVEEVIPPPVEENPTPPAVDTLPQTGEEEVPIYTVIMGIACIVLGCYLRFNKHEN